MNDVETIGVLVKALALIEANPTHWNQSVWHCGTSHCLAGFCDIVVDGRGETDLNCLIYPENSSRFDIDHRDLAYLFDVSLSLDYLQWEVAHLVEKQTIDGFDSEGFDVDGRDRWSYDRGGYDCDGYDVEGYDWNGFDANEYDRDGFDRDGYDSDDYDKKGYDREGYNRHGFNSDGYDSDGLDEYGNSKWGYGEGDDYEFEDDAETD